MEKTMTIREGFEKARALYEQMGDAEMVAFFEGRLAQVEKKNSGTRKPSAKQVENAEIKDAIQAWMADGQAYVAGDVAKECPACEGMSVQRVSALLSQMAKAGVLSVTVEKRKNFYTLAE